MTVAVVTPWQNHQEFWPDYEKAMQLGPAPDELIIVDNGSTPPLPFVTLRNDYNAGFSRASNQGLRAATSDVVVFCNNDIWASAAGWLEKLAAAVELGVLAGALMRRDRHADIDGTAMPYLDGWCLAGMREDLLEIGGFDETLAEPSYFSDNLLCLEARVAGFELREVRVGLVHKLNGTAKDDPRSAAAVLTNRATYVRRARELLASVAA